MIAEQTTLDPVLYVLNPTLYWFLAKRVGPVRVTHRGETRTFRTVLDDEADRRVRVARHGEQYRVDCFVCGDRRQQLSVNYMYGQPDGAGGRLLNLAYCHASNCMASSANRTALAARLVADDNFDFARLRPWAAGGTGGADDPPTATRLDRLPARHPARTYLRSRGVNPDKVGRVYGGSYTDTGTPRIIVSLECGGTRWGWWTTPVPEPGAALADKAAGESVPAVTAADRQPPYNLDRARRYQTGVIVPSPLHVWAVGPMAVCQPNALVRDDAFRGTGAAFAGHTLVVVVTPEDKNRVGVKKMIDYFSRRMPGRVAVAEVPAAVLAGKIDRKSLRKEIRRQARAQGVEVVYERRA